ncbi:hypothetical protein [Escherichia coli]|uniref:Uncharacterized protein n=1 Tax=Escherichia coli TA447 TaxID=656447 RepID=A0A1X3J3S9_ECOLX|nr:hypothetical protein [Escherichia coli]OSK95558.1 hypothetical protein ECXG_02099 [Escherichia coli TA447]
MLAALKGFVAILAVVAIYCLVVVLMDRLSD